MAGDNVAGSPAYLPTSSIRRIQSPDLRRSPTGFLTVAQRGFCRDRHNCWHRRLLHLSGPVKSQPPRHMATDRLLRQFPLLPLVIQHQPSARALPTMPIFA